MEKSSFQSLPMENLNSKIKKSLLKIGLFNIIGLFVILLLSTSCGGAKTKTPSPEIVTSEGVKVYNPKTGRYEFPIEVTGKMDTVKWADAGSIANDPIESDPSQYLKEDPIISDPTSNPNGTGFFSTYNVAIMIPFNAHRVNDLEGTIHSSSLSPLNFYEGAKMALDELANEGLNLNVTVMDTKRSESETESLLNRSELLNAHLIIGPYSSKPLNKVAEFAKQNSKPLISPLNTSGNITSENPFYIQSNPSLKSHCEAIMNHALENYSADQIVLIVRDKEAEVNRLIFFQDVNKLVAGDPFTPPIKEYRIDPTVAEEFGQLDLLPYIKEDQTTVFIVPSYSNETFVSNFMRQVEIAKGRNDVVVYGMPRWMEYERISYDYYERLKLHVSSANFIDKEDIKVKDFTRKFYERYGALPDNNTFKGYDLTLYFGRQLQKHGMNLYNEIDSELEQMLTTKFEFERNVTPENVRREQLEAINFIENKYVNILKYENYHFQKVN